MVVAVQLAASACSTTLPAPGSSGETFPTIAIEPRAPVISLRRVVELTAVSTTGMELRKDLPFEWSSSDADIAAVIGFNERANVTGVGLGTAVITVRVGEASATTRVRVQTGG